MNLISSCRSIPRTCLCIQTSRFDDIMLFIVLGLLVVGLILV
jgi:hypothetical protein